MVKCVLILLYSIWLFIMMTSMLMKIVVMVMVVMLIMVTMMTMVTMVMIMKLMIMDTKFKDPNIYMVERAVDKRTKVMHKHMLISTMLLIICTEGYYRIFAIMGRVSQRRCFLGGIFTCDRVS